MALSLLLLESDSDFRRAVARVLARNGFIITQAGTHDEARGFDGRFDLGVFGLDLPDGDALRLARDMLSRGRLGSVAFLTSAGESRAEIARPIGPVVGKEEGIRALTEVLIHLVAKRRLAPPRRRLPSSPP